MIIVAIFPLSGHGGHVLPQRRLEDEEEEIVTGHSSDSDDSVDLPPLNGDQPVVLNVQVQRSDAHQIMRNPLLILSRDRHWQAAVDRMLGPSHDQLWWRWGAALQTAVRARRRRGRSASYHTYPYAVPRGMPSYTIYIGIGQPEILQTLQGPDEHLCVFSIRGRRREQTPNDQRQQPPIAQRQQPSSNRVERVITGYKVIESFEAQLEIRLQLAE